MLPLTLLDSVLPRLRELRRLPHAYESRPFFDNIRQIQERFIKLKKRHTPTRLPFNPSVNVAGLDRIIEGLILLSDHSVFWHNDIAVACKLILDPDATIEALKERLKTPGRDSDVVVQQLKWVLQSKHDLNTVISTWHELHGLALGYQLQGAMASAYDFVGGFGSPKDGLVALIAKTRNVSDESAAKSNKTTGEKSSTAKLDSKEARTTKSRGDNQRPLGLSDLPRAYIHSLMAERKIELWEILIDTYPEDLRLEEDLASALKECPHLRAPVWKRRLYSYPRNWRFQTRLHEACRGNLEEVECFTELVSKCPDSLGLQAYLERAYPTFESQINGWQALVVEHPFEETLRTKLVTTFAKTHDIDVAISGWVEVINKVPSNIALQTQLAASLTAKGDCFLSTKVWRELVEENPNELTLRARLAEAYATEATESALSLYLTVHYPTSVMRKIQESSEALLSYITPFIKEGEEFEVSAGYDTYPEDIDHDVADGCEDFFTGNTYPSNVYLEGPVKPCGWNCSMSRLKRCSALFVKLPKLCHRIRLRCLRSRKNG